MNLIDTEIRGLNQLLLSIYYQFLYKLLTSWTRLRVAILSFHLRWAWIRASSPIFLINNFVSCVFSGSSATSFWALSDIPLIPLTINRWKYKKYPIILKAATISVFIMYRKPNYNKQNYLRHWLQAFLQVSCTWRLGDFEQYSATQVWVQ